MKKKRTNRVSVTHAIDLYYNKHKKELLKKFKTERRAKFHMRNDVDDLPSNYFKTHKQANEVFNDWYDRNVNPEAAQLKQAKRDAVNKEIWSSQRELNGKLKVENLEYSGKSLGVTNKIYREVTDYYTVTNSDYILAHIRAHQGKTEYEYWEYIDKGLIA